MKWDTIELGEVIDVKHGYAFKSEFYSDAGEYILLTPGNCYESGGLKLKGEAEKYYTGKFPPQFMLEEGNILVVMTDLINHAPILGGSLIIPENNRFLHNQRLGLVQITDASRVDPGYLYYLFNTHEYRGQVRASASGATLRHTSPKRIKQCRVRIPRDVTYQRNVAEILSNYDRLIENNRRRIELIEEAARQLHREWFQRLRFPGFGHGKVKDGVPNGWHRRVLGELCRAVKETVLPETLEPDTPYIGLEHMPRRSITLSEWGTADQVTSLKSRFCEGDILFGKIRPYFHKVGITFVSGVASSDAIVIRVVEDKLFGLVLMTVSSDVFVAHTAQTMKEGSKMPRADWKQMQQYLVPVPPDGLLNSFESAIRPIADELKSLALINQRLRVARDLLVPRLTTGAIKI